MKTPHWIILILTMILATWFVYRTRNTFPRHDENIDLNWRFARGEFAGAENPLYDHGAWDYVNLPHDWMIEAPVAESNPSGTAGGFYEGGVAWYRKVLDLESLQDKKHFTLLFEGVFHNADVWLNGTHLGRQAYGYASFHHDISQLVRFDTLNVISVRTDCDFQPTDRWYSGAGIYRSVRLIATDDLHIPVWGTHIHSRMDSLGRAVVEASVEVRNTGRRDERFDLLLEIAGPEGDFIQDARMTHLTRTGECDTLRHSFVIENPELWSPSDPALYSLNCKVAEGNRILDQVKIRHGIRTAVFSPEKGFILNGKKTILKGVNIHHDGGGFGAAVPLASWERRLKVLKELGVNALRLAHNPHAPGVLDLCDQMGFLVIDEMYDKWELTWDPVHSNEAMWLQHEKDLAGFIRRDRNHPSVVLWSVGNETVEQLDDPERGIEIYRELMNIVSIHDSTREISCGLHPGHEPEVPSSMMTVSNVVCYNYRSDSFAIWHERYPELVFIASETKAYGTYRPEDYRVLDWSGNSWNDMHEYVAGQFIWSGIDYLGESPHWPVRGFGKGLVSSTGFIKAHAWYIASRYLEEPMVRLAVLDEELADSLNADTNWQVSWEGAPLTDHWSFQDNPGTRQVVVFTNCGEVELFLNGRSLGSHKCSDFSDGVIRAEVPWEKGTLLARSASASDSLVSSHRAHSLAMNPDKERTRAGESGLVHITTEVTDSLGIRNPHSDHMVSYSLDGPGRIRLVDNGDLAEHSDPSSTSRKVRRGRQLLVLQAGSEPGDLIISASAEGLQPAKIKITNEK